MPVKQANNLRAQEYASAAFRAALRPVTHGEPPVFTEGDRIFA
jgi:hypothetical protein